MSYFLEVDDYRTYTGKEDDFHFIYNANTGGGQSFLGGKFRDKNGDLASPTSLNGRIAVFRFLVGTSDTQHDVLLADDSTTYEIKPRAEGDSNMKLSVGGKPTPSSAITTFLMLPEPCGVKRSADVNTSVLNGNNYWLQSMWLGVDTTVEGKAIFTPKDCIICGGVDKQGQGSARYFAVDFRQRISDIIQLAGNSSLEGDVLSCVKHFADIYSGNKPFAYEESAAAIKAVMKYLSTKYPEQYSGTLDPLSFIQELSHSSPPPVKQLGPRQRITYGAPGAGKSYRVDGLCDCKDVVKCFRTTFHPDSDYSTFVGAYKPTMAGEKIAYEFRPQAFMDAYVEAWKAMVQPDDGEVKNVVLVIEEINRGNCAQIFGDLFQLLDRGNGGYSTYPIDADNDIAIWLAKQFGNTLDGLAKPDEIRRQDDWTDVLTCKKLALPPNLYIWATMNTSDQSLFPIDSAFKRRWDWEYVPIAKPDKSGDANWKERKIEVGDALFDWWDFLSAINGHIAKATESEDKQLGYFFVKADDATGYISAKQFANKVLFYLFGDVFKSYELPKKDCFQLANNTVLAFRDFFYNEKVKEGDGASQVTREPGDVKLETVAAFLRNLKWDGKGVNEGTKDQTDGSQGEH